MYPDPKRVKDNRIMLRVDDYDFDAILTLSETLGEQPSVLVRKLAMSSAFQLLKELDISLEKAPPQWKAQISSSKVTAPKASGLQSVAHCFYCAA